MGWKQDGKSGRKRKGRKAKQVAVTHPAGPQENGLAGQTRQRREPRRGEDGFIESRITINQSRLHQRTTDMACFELIEKMAPNAVIKVIGVGGGGGNAVAHMVNSSVDGVEFIIANTDSQAIKNCGAKLQLQLGGNVTKGLGAGANPEVGRQAALEDREQIIAALEGADMVFITAGMGGGTGTGAAPVVAQLAKEMGILTVAVVTKPFPFEGRRRMQVALKGIEELSQHCDSLITIPNEKLITVLGR